MRMAKSLFRQPLKASRLCQKRSPQTARNFSLGDDLRKSRHNARAPGNAQIGVVAQLADFLSNDFFPIGK
jgi:hypothetical protein